MTEKQASSEIAQSREHTICPTCRSESPRMQRIVADRVCIDKFHFPEPRERIRIGNELVELLARYKIINLDAWPNGAELLMVIEDVLRQNKNLQAAERIRGKE